MINELLQSLMTNCNNNNYNYPVVMIRCYVRKLFKSRRTAGPEDWGLEPPIKNSAELCQMFPKVSRKIIPFLKQSAFKILIARLLSRSSGCVGTVLATVSSYVFLTIKVVERGL